MSFKTSFSPYKDDWNMNKGFLDHLVEIIIQVDQAAETGDVMLWFNRLRLLYRNVAGLLRRTDNKKMVKCKSKQELDELFMEIKKLFPNRTPITSNELNIARVRTELIKSKLDELNVEIITAMHFNNLILPLSQADPSKAGLEM